MFLMEHSHLIANILKMLVHRQRISSVGFQSKIKGKYFVYFLLIVFIFYYISVNSVDVSFHQFFIFYHVIFLYFQKKRYSERQSATQLAQIKFITCKFIIFVLSLVKSISFNLTIDLHKYLENQIKITIIIICNLLLHCIITNKY